MPYDVEDSGHPDDNESDYLINSTCDDKNNKPLTNSHSPSQLRRCSRPLVPVIISTSLITVLVCGLLLYFISLLRNGSSTRSPGTTFGSCGDTPSAARSMNCTFDIMSFSWLSPHCSDLELVDEFLAVRNWTWWVDANRTEEVSLEKVSSGHYNELFVTREYHMYHCTYMWRKLHRGMLRSKENLERRGVVDTYIGRYSHTAHCEMMLLGMEDGEEVDKDSTDTAILLKYPQCMWV